MPQAINTEKAQYRTVVFTVVLGQAASPSPGTLLEMCVLITESEIDWHRDQESVLMSPLGDSDAHLFENYQPTGWFQEL